MNVKHVLFGVFFLFLMVKTEAQVTISGEFRPRSEYRSGFQKLLADSLQPALLTLQRTRLNFDYQTKILNARLSLQDSRIWGKSLPKGSDSKIEIFEAWAEYLIASGLSAQFGRQALKYDDQRLIGNSNWSNSGNAHDILLLKYKSARSLEAHLGLAYNNTSDTLMEISYNLKKMYKSMGLFWLSKSFGKGYGVSVIGIAEGFQKTNDYEIIYPRFTYGGNFSYANDSSILGAYATAYFQSGKNTSFKDLNAYMFALKTNLKVYKQNAVIAGFDYFSGSKPNISGDKSSTFEKLYGANHAFNGNMEYWRSNPTSGLLDVYLGLSGKITKKISLDLTLHNFSLAEKHLSGTKELDKNMGAEVDIIGNIAISKEISLQAGYCRYLNSKSTKDYFKMGNVDAALPQWAYVMFTIKPDFYKTPVTDNK